VVELRKDWKTANVKNYDALREKQMSILLKIEQALLEDLVEPDKAKVWLAIRKDVSSLLGLDAPSRSLSVSLNMKNMDDMTEGELIQKMMEGLSSEKTQKVYAFIMQMHDEQVNEAEVKKLPKPPETQDEFHARMRQQYPDQFKEAGDPPAKTLVEGVVISPSGEAMRLGHGDGKK
jgi:hypothetical protein